MLRALSRCCRPGSLPVPLLPPPPGPGSGSGSGHGLCPGWSPRVVPARGRKSRHDPPAKSKAGRLKLPPPVDPEELLVVQERYRQHRLVLGALRAEFRAEVLQKKREERLGGENSEELLEEHRRLMAWNDEENARQRARREERLRKEAEEEKRRKLEVMEKQTRKMEAFMKEKEKEVLQLQMPCWFLKATRPRICPKEGLGQELSPGWSKEDPRTLGGEGAALLQHPEGNCDPAVTWKTKTL